MFMNAISFRDRITAPVDDTCRATGLGRTKIYELVKERKLKLVHIGRKSLITAESVNSLLREIGAIQ